MIRETIPAGHTHSIRYELEDEKIAVEHMTPAQLDKRITELYERVAELEAAEAWQLATDATQKITSEHKTNVVSMPRMQKQRTTEAGRNADAVRQYIRELRNAYAEAQKTKKDYNTQPPSRELFPNLAAYDRATRPRGGVHLPIPKAEQTYELDMRAVGEAISWENWMQFKKVDPTLRNMFILGVLAEKVEPKNLLRVLQSTLLPDMAQLLEQVSEVDFANTNHPIHTYMLVYKVSPAQIAQIAYKTYASIAQQESEKRFTSSSFEERMRTRARAIAQQRIN